MRKFLDVYGKFLAPVLVVAAILIYWARTRTPPPRKPPVTSAFFVDEDTGEPSIHSLNEIPPLVGKHGARSVVRAIKFSCDGGKNSAVLYLSKYTDAAQAQLNAISMDDATAEVQRSRLMDTGELVRLPAPGSPWVLANSPQAAAIQALPDCPNSQGGMLVNP